MNEPDERARGGLCATCVHLELLRSQRGSVFFRCRLADVDARFPKYPPLPVVRCAGHEPRREERR